jgi:hypothetical protein
MEYLRTTGVASYFSCTSDATAETYDSVAGTWTLTGDLPAIVGSGSVAVRLLDGRVLASGGGNRCGDVFATAALFDPSTNTWSPTASMTIPRQFHSAVLLSSGRVLVAGGATSAPFDFVPSAEIFDPATGTWAAVGSMITARGASPDGYVLSYLSLLPTDAVLAAGALTGASTAGVPTATAERFSSSTASWSSTGAMSAARAFTTLTALIGGFVLVAGGFDGVSTVSSAEVFNPATGVWSLTGSLNAPRSFHTATLLANGDVLIAGGNDSRDTLATAEIYHAVAPPVITSLTGFPNVLWPPNHKMVRVSLNVSTPGFPTPVCRISSVSSNELPTAPGETDWIVRGPLALDLRSERAGSGNGRVYIITVTCANEATSSASKTATVRVPHDRAR